MALIVWPAIAAARRPADEVGRPTGTPFLRRTGLDIVLLVLAVVGLWQLQRTGSVASAAEPGGRTSVDPVLVLAPTLGIAAASLLAVRMLGVAANGLERIGGAEPAGWRRRWQVVRRRAPAAGGTARRCWVVVAVAVASFALIQSVSWERSQRDQADAAVGADVVVVPDGRPDAGVAPAHLAAGYRALDGVTAGLADRRSRGGRRGSPDRCHWSLSTPSEFATDSRTARRGGGRRDRRTLAAPVDLGGVELPASGGEVTARIRLSASTPAPDGEAQPTPTEAEIAIIVTDEFGTLRRLSAVEPIVTADGGATTTEVSFGRLDATGGEDRPGVSSRSRSRLPIPFVDVRTFVTDVDGDGVDDTSPLDVPSVRTGIELLELDVDGAALDVGLATWTPLAPAPGRFTISPPAASVDTVDTVDTVDAVDAQLALDLDAGTTAQRQASAQLPFRHRGCRGRRRLRRWLHGGRRARDAAARGGTRGRARRPRSGSGSGAAGWRCASWARPGSCRSQPTNRWRSSPTTPPWPLPTTWRVGHDPSPIVGWWCSTSPTATGHGAPA